MLEFLENYRRISDLLHTAAQPNAKQFERIKQAGVATVINLATGDSPGALSNEAQIVQENNMDYIPIPVDFKRPAPADLQLFCNAMTEHADKITLVHCAYNWRVSCFVYLYRIIGRGCEERLAREDLLAVWKPDKIWQSFIDDRLAAPARLADKKTER